MAETETVDISDDDEEEEQFVDAEEWQGEGEAQRQRQGQRQWEYPAEVKDYLQGLGVRPRSEWLQECMMSMGNRHREMSVAQQAEECLSRFMFADINTAGDAILPPNIHTLHATDIPGPFFLQISLRNVHVRRGLLMLVPEVVDVLGGVVENLEAARQRLFQEVNKPPRGRRSRRGEDVLSLASRALGAAWPPDSSNIIPVTNDAVSRETVLSQSSSPGGETFQRTPIEILPTSGSNLNHQRNVAADMTMDLDRLDLVDEGIDHQLLESEESENPFTYLACLKARKQLEPVIQGRIKCILTGVKEFQFKERDKFELFVYVDDGSLISEVLIDHQVVQSIIGQSPREVTASLTSGDRQRVEAIKETMKNFQLLLRKFEGQMLVELNDELAVPIVLEMREGCDDTWPWLLFRRCKRKHYMLQ